MRIRFIFMWVLLFSSFVRIAYGVLAQVGPTNPNNGFPVWYQDIPGLRLDLCLDGDGVNGPCFFDPPVPGNAFSQQIGFGPEAFWWSADASLSIPASPALPVGGRALLVLAMEAAFTTPDPENGKQVAFGRVRIRMSTPVAGTYRIIHPFGIQVFENVPAGVDTIRFSDDIGNFATPGANFGDALSSSIGPFLRWDTEFPFIDPVTNKQYVGNPLVEHTVTGSPFATNFFRIEGPPGSNLDGAGGNFIQTNLFTVMGKISIGIPLALNDNATTPKATPVTINVISNDIATEVGASIVPSSVLIVSQPINNGTTAPNPDGTVIYTPSPNFFFGIDSFTYTVKDTNNKVSDPATVRVTVNVPPVAVNDTATTVKGAPVTINVISNDSDPDATAGDSLVPGSVQIVSQPTNGTAVKNPDGTVTYTPHANFVGTDSFTYTVKDSTGAPSNAATVNVTVNAPVPPVTTTTAVTTTPTTIPGGPAIVPEVPTTVPTTTSTTTTTTTTAPSTTTTTTTTVPGTTTTTTTVIPGVVVAPSPSGVEFREAVPDIKTSSPAGINIGEEIIRTLEVLTKISGIQLQQKPDGIIEMTLPTFPEGSISMMPMGKLELVSAPSGPKIEANIGGTVVITTLGKPVFGPISVGLKIEVTPAPLSFSGFKSAAEKAEVTIERIEMFSGRMEIRGSIKGLRFEALVRPDFVVTRTQEPPGLRLDNQGNLVINYEGGRQQKFFLLSLRAL